MEFLAFTLISLVALFVAMIGGAAEVLTAEREREDEEKP